MERCIIVTGGAGFIGSNFIFYMFRKHPDYRIVCVDALTYAGNLASLAEVSDSGRFRFEKADICNYARIRQLMSDYNVDGIIHLAAESHVDRSIKDPFAFAYTNVIGTLTLLQAAKLYWESTEEKYEGKLFYRLLMLNLPFQTPFCF